MSIKRPDPINAERTFLIEELFFSVADKKGIILDANEVFIRISDYPWEQLKGAPHNLIRHPDMPRCVFKVFWDFLNSGRPIVAYVKNLAADGRYYWVLTLTFPCEKGFLSIRLKPSTELQKTAEQAYRQALQIEREALMEMSPNEAMLKAETWLVGAIKQLGFTDYESFMVYALEQELVHRQELLKNLNDGTLTLQQANAKGAFEQLGVHLSDFFASVSKIKGLNTTLVEGLGDVERFCSDIHLQAINTQMAALKLSNNSRPISVIGGRLQTIATELGTLLIQFRSEVHALAPLLNASAFSILSGTLQIEMAANFSRESTAQQNAEAMERRQKAISLLGQICKERIHSLLNSLEPVQSTLENIASRIDLLYKQIQSLHLIHSLGNIESARVRECHAIGEVLRLLNTEIHRAAEGVPALEETVQQNIRLIKDLLNKHREPMLQLSAKAALAGEEMSAHNHSLALR